MAENISLNERADALERKMSQYSGLTCDSCPLSKSKANF